MPKMLIIDDNVEFKTMVSYYFLDIGYTVELAENGREGVAKARTTKPDIILLDVMMPEVGGIEVLRELQAHDETRTVPVVVITGTYFDKNMSGLFRQEPNCREFLSKTTELAAVQAKIEPLLKK